MNKTRNQRHKPFYKKILRLRKNIQNRPKIFNFKRDKWKSMQNYSRKQLSFSRRFKISDQYQLNVVKFASRGNAFQKKFKLNLLERKTFNLFYGGLKRKYLKKKINFIKNTKTRNFKTFQHQLFTVLESRLDVVLYRTNFASSIRNARQIILHGHILINKKTIRTSSYILQTNDMIELVPTKKSHNLIKKNIVNSNFWPIPPKHLVVNYNTLQIIFLNDIRPIFNHYLSVDSIIKNVNNY